MKRLREVREVISNNKHIMVIGGHKSTKLRDAQEKHKQAMKERRNKKRVRKKWKNGGSWEYQQGRTVKQEEDSARMAGYAIIALIVLGIVLVFV